MGAEHQGALRAADHGTTHAVRTGMRVIGAVVGGYALTALAVAAAGALLSRLGMARSEAVVLAAMFGFIAYLVVLLWGFSVRSVTRLWLVLTGTSAVLAVLLYWLA